MKHKIVLRDKKNTQAIQFLDLINNEFNQLSIDIEGTGDKQKGEKHFPFDMLLDFSPTLLKNPDEITWELNHRYFKIEDYDGFIKALDDAKSQNSPMYWGYYKIANRIAVPKV